MKSTIKWQASKLTFKASNRQHQYTIDTQTATGGGDQGPTPKELLLTAVAGCTGMDIVGLLKKSKIEATRLEVISEGETTKEHPKVFTEIKLAFIVEGPSALRQPLIDAVHKSQTLFCGVSAMLAKACPIVYTVNFNGEDIHQGRADFPS